LTVKQHEGGFRIKGEIDSKGAAGWIRIKGIDNKVA
jgi:hypothetical protein